jgi:hypothetical protein
MRGKHDGEQLNNVLNPAARQVAVEFGLVLQVGLWQVSRRLGLVPSVLRQIRTPLPCAASGFAVPPKITRFGIRRHFDGEESKAEDPPLKIDLWRVSSV